MKLLLALLFLSLSGCATLLEDDSPEDQQPEPRRPTMGLQMNTEKRPDRVSTHSEEPAEPETPAQSERRQMGFQMMMEGLSNRQSFGDYYLQSQQQQQQPQYQPQPVQVQKTPQFKNCFGEMKPAWAPQGCGYLCINDQWTQVCR